MTVSAPPGTGEPSLAPCFWMPGRDVAQAAALRGEMPRSRRFARIPARALEGLWSAARVVAAVVTAARTIGDVGERSGSGSKPVSIGRFQRGGVREGWRATENNRIRPGGGTAQPAGDRERILAGVCQMD